MGSAKYETLTANCARASGRNGENGGSWREVWGPWKRTAADEQFGSDDEGGEADDSTDNAFVYSDEI
jgi:hypothetical protein